MTVLSWVANFAPFACLLGGIFAGLIFGAERTASVRHQLDVAMFNNHILRVRLQQTVRSRR